MVEWSWEPNRNDREMPRANDGSYVSSARGSESRLATKHLCSAGRLPARLGRCCQVRAIKLPRLSILLQSGGHVFHVHRVRRTAMTGEKVQILRRQRDLRASAMLVRQGGSLGQAGGSISLISNTSERAPEIDLDRDRQASSSASARSEER